MFDGQHKTLKSWRGYARVLAWLRASPGVATCESWRGYVRVLAWLHASDASDYVTFIIKHYIHVIVQALHLFAVTSFDVSV